MHVQGLDEEARQWIVAMEGVVPLLNGAAPPNTLGRKGDGNKYPKAKDYIITVEQTKYPSLHCQGVGPLQYNIRGGPLP